MRGVTVPVAVVVVVMMAIARNIPPLERLFLLWTEGALYKLGRVLAGKFWQGALVGAHFGFVEKGARRCTLRPLLFGDQRIWSGEVSAYQLPGQHNRPLRA